MFRIEKSIEEKIDDLLDIVEDCLQDKNLPKQEEALEKLFELNKRVRDFLKLPLSQQSLDRYLNL